MTESRGRRVVAVAQMVEHRVVDADVAGSRPVGHPTVPSSSGKDSALSRRQHRFESGWDHHGRVALMAMGDCPFTAGVAGSIPVPITTATSSRKEHA